MDKCAIIRLCKELGCCDACCLRYLGLRHPGAYENPHTTLLKYLDDSQSSGNTTTTTPHSSSKGSDRVTDTVIPMDIDDTTDVRSDKSSCHDVLSSEDKPSSIDIQTTGNPKTTSNDTPATKDQSGDSPLSSVKIISKDNQISEKPSSCSNLSTDKSLSTVLPSDDRLTSGNDKVSIDLSSSTVKLSSNDDQLPTDLLPTSTPSKADTLSANLSPTSEGTPTADHSGPSPKRARRSVCVTCLGILEEASWPQALDMVQEEVEKKRYSCGTFACALSAPHATLLREAAVALRVRALGLLPRHAEIPTPLKEAWKWSFGAALARRVRKALGSGAVAPLLVALAMEYAGDAQELENLKILSPQLFRSRSKQKKRFTVEFTRRSVEQALDGVTLAALQRLDGWREGVPAAAAARCASVTCTHTALFLGGRYVKLSRSLPQTPWVLNGERMMETSVQEIIFEPIAKLYGMTDDEASRRMKFMSAGREDVDVRCLGDGRPFAIEIADPHGELSADQLSAACVEMSRRGDVLVRRLVHVSREHLTLLKKGEETKTKTYSALCIKLGPTAEDTKQDVAQTSQYLAQTSLAPAQSSQELVQTSQEKAHGSQDLAQTSLAPAQSSQELAQTSQELAHGSQDLAQTSLAPAQSSQELVQTSQELAHGSQDLAQTSLAPAQSSQELAQTSQEMAHASQGLAQTSLALTQSSQELAQTSQELAYASQDLAQTSLAPAQSSQELAQTSQELAHASQGLAQTSLALTQSSQKLTQTSQKLAHASQEFAQTSQELAHASQDLAQTTIAPVQSSQELAQTSHDLDQTSLAPAQSREEFAHASQDLAQTSQHPPQSSIDLTRTALVSGKTSRNLSETSKDSTQISPDSTQLIGQTSRDSELTSQDTAQTSIDLARFSKHSTQTALDSGQSSLDPTQTQHPAQTSQDAEKPCPSSSHDLVQSLGKKARIIVKAAPRPVAVTAGDIARINAYRNTPPGAAARVQLSQKTPIRVLHRRPLLTRVRRIYELSAELVEGHPHLFVVRVKTEAGTYVKEWVHGELGRSAPALCDALGAPADILALDVQSVDLDWP